MQDENTSAEMPQMPSLSPTPKKPQHEFAGFFIVLVSSLALVSIVLNNSMELDKKREAVEAKKMAGVAGVDAANADTTAVDMYAGWETYANTDLGFSLKYPADWKNVSKNGLALRTAEQQAKLDNGTFTFENNFSVTVYDSNKDLPNNTEGLSLAGWVADPTIYLVNNVTPVIIDGVSGYQTIVGGEGESYIIYAEHNGRIYAIDTPYIPSDEEQKIIDSFTFITSTVADPYAGWQTYTNNSLGITFRYPVEFVSRGVAGDCVGSDPSKDSLGGRVCVSSINNPNGFTVQQYADNEYKDCLAERIAAGDGDQFCGLSLIWENITTSRVSEFPSYRSGKLGGEGSNRDYLYIDVGNKWIVISASFLSDSFHETFNKIVGSVVVSK